MGKKELNTDIYWIVIRQVLFLMALMFILCNEAFSQEEDSIRRAPKRLFVGLTLGSGQARITEDGMLSVAKMQSGNATGMLASAEIGYMLSRHFGVFSGVSFSSYNSRLSLDAYQNNFTTVDSENETYERRISGTTIQEKQNIAYLGVPLMLNFSLPLGRKMGFSLKTGIDLAVPIVKNYHSTGVFTYKGYYPRYNVLLENLPAYGFPSNATVSTSGNLNLKPLYVDASASAGFDFMINTKLQAAIALYYSRSLSAVQAYSQPDKFQLSTDLNQINSLMGGTSNVTIQSAGLKISLMYSISRR